MEIDIRVRPPVPPAPQGKLADVEVHFASGVLAGLKLVGFAVWEARDARGRTVSFPSRRFLVHGERRHFALLRAARDLPAQQPLREMILRAYADGEGSDGTPNVH